ncbi:MAG TPA: RnfABCDGE type electron transport complex subunit B [Steroidobacteraceae bacterium]|nr:RnfABCDGE type electron transport complex subunit B [Steroidobacteraceae bacterium]
MSEHQNDVNTIDALLPQTQCTRCGFEGCRPYAQALADGSTGINRCPPGGAPGIAALASLLGREVLPLDPSCGSEEDPGVAAIDARECIGCARCLPVCPVDSIIGAHRYLHTVLESACTGCELCIDACPVDCIEMRPRSPGEPAPSRLENRSRYQAHCARAERETQDKARLLAERKRTAHSLAVRSR